MKNKLSQTIGSTLMLFLAAISSNYAQDVTTVEASSEAISDNLDLEAVASIFGDARDLEDFELKLNDPETQISNLDLNEDGNVDYLRVVETAENDTHLIAVQSVLGEDIYQDVATIEVEKDAEGATKVQIVGDVYLYGSGYIIEPVYVVRPSVFSLFWAPRYRPYRSVYYWGYYPKHHFFWKPFHTRHYKKHVHVHVNVKHTYHYTHVRRSKTAVHLHSKTRRNDYALKHPGKAHTVRVAGVNKSNGTKKRAVGVNQADGTKKRAVGVNKADGTKKRAASVTNADGSKKTVAVKKNPDGSTRAVAVKKNADGSRKVKTGKKKASPAKKRSRGKRKKKK